MQRLAQSAAAFGAACVLTGGLLVGSASASNGPLMTGAIKQGAETAISAHGSYTAARGELTAAQFFHGTVTCLEVTGNDGIATAVIDTSQDPAAFPVGETVVAEGVDTDAAIPKNVTPGLATDLWRLSFASNGGIFPDFAHPGCFLPLFPPVPIASGDILVSPGS